jgi:hypothetical protein
MEEIRRMASHMSKVIASLAVLVSVTGMSACNNQPEAGFTDIATDRAVLMDGFQSYWGIQELEAHLKGAGNKWEVEKGKGPTSGDSRPPFVIDTVKVKSYSHLGAEGELHILLFNNRLTSTIFFPKNVGNYVAQLAKTKGIDLSKKEEVRTSANTRVWLAEAGKEKRKYVGWEDSRLSKQMDDWIRKYS